MNSIINKINNNRGMIILNSLQYMHFKLIEVIDTMIKLPHKDMVTKLKE